MCTRRAVVELRGLMDSADDALGDVHGPCSLLFGHVLLCSFLLLTLGFVSSVFAPVFLLARSGVLASTLACMPVHIVARRVPLCRSTERCGSLISDCSP